MNLGDIRLGDTVDFKFTTRRFSSGAPFTLAGTPAVACYVGDSTTEITAGVTLTVDFDSRTGCNHVRIVATSGNGFATASDVDVVITAGTVDSVSVVGEVVARFSIEKRSALMPTTAGRTLAVGTAGQADSNVTQYGGTNGTFAGGRPEVNTTHFGGTGGTFASGRPEVNTSHIGGSTTPVTNIGVVYNTDFASNYDTINDRWVVSIDTDGLSAASIHADVAAEARGWLGLAAADLDTQLDALAATLGTPVNLGGGATLAANAADIEAQTDDIAGVPAAVWAVGARTITGGTVGTITGLTIANVEDMAARFLGMIELDGAVYRYTVNALEQAPAGGGGGSTDWTADERAAMRAILGIPASGTTPADPSTGIMDTIRDAVLAVKVVTDALSPRLPGSGTLSTLTAAQVWAHVLSNALSADATLIGAATAAQGAENQAGEAVAGTNFITGLIGTPSNLGSGATLAGNAADINANASAAALLDAANGVESGVTLRQALRALAAALGGNVTGGGTAYAAIGNSGTPRLAVVDGGGGNRTVTPSL